MNIYKKGIHGSEKIKIFAGVGLFCLCILAKTQGSFLLWGIGILFSLSSVIVSCNYKLIIKFNRKQLLLISAWIIFCLSYTVTSSNVGEAISGIIQMTLFFLLVTFGTFLADFYDKDTIEKTFMGICFIIFITALYGIFEYITSSNPLNSFFYVQRELLDSETARTMSVYIHPIYFSQVLIIGICINYYFNKSYAKRLIYNLAFVFALYTTKTRGAWIIFAILLLLITTRWIKNNGRLKKKSIFWGFFVIACLLIMNYQFNFFSSIISRFAALEGGASIGQRMDAGNYIINSFFHSSLLNQILGHGMLGTANELRQVTFFYQEFVATDNQWISWLYNNGLIFVLIIILFTIYAIVMFLKSKDPIIKFMVTIYLAYLGLSFFVEIGSAFAGNLFFFIPMGYLLRQNIK